ncbi:MAG: PAC2 family protein [Candidatus Micrarchaeaceae archaeon]
MKTFKIKKDLKLKNPILVAGWPGVGNVGKIATEYLIHQLKAKKIAILTSPYFPHEVIMSPSGRITMLSNKIYLAHVQKKSGKQLDLLILTGNTQPVSPEGQYHINEKIVKIFKNIFKGSSIYTLAGYNDSTSIGLQRIFVAATSSSVLQKIKNANLHFSTTRSSIWGSAGLTIAFAKRYHLDGACIMGETNGTEFDASAAQRVLEFISTLLNIDIDMTEMQSLIKETNKFIKEMEEQISGNISFPETITKGGTNPSYIR